MPNVIEELLQNGSVDPAALSAQLRRENEYGMVGSASGSSRLAPLALRTQQNAMAQAEGIGANRRDQANTDMSNSLEQWKAEMAAAAKRAELRQRRDEGDANRSNARQMNAERVRASRDNAALRSGKSAASDVTPDALVGEAEILEGLADKAVAAMKESSWGNTGWRSLAAGIGGPGNNLRGLLMPLQSREALGKLADLKEASRTGASGLGSVTEKEIELLMNNITSLEQIQGQAQLDEAIKSIEVRYRALARKLRDAAAGKVRETPSGWRTPNVSQTQDPGGDNDDMLAAPEDDTEADFNSGS